jgi:hypothetical protein
MFLQLATALAAGNPALTQVQASDLILTNYRPTQLLDALEQYWRQGLGVPAMDLDVPLPDHTHLGRPGILDNSGLAAGVGEVPMPWHHLVYAFMLENTRMHDIFRRVVFEYTHGERLPHATPQVHRWVRTTEALFFTHPQAWSVRGVTSSLRPDDGAIRRNAYHRMLGMDLLHGMEDGRPYPYVRADVANREFATLFEALLAETWKGFINVPNQAGENQTDNTAIATLVRRLEEMLVARRLDGMLSREEFDAVSTLSWFHLVIATNNAVITGLSANANGEADRLRKIGDRVGLTPHARSDAFLQLAQPMSNILRAIESGALAAVGPAGIYNGAVYTNDMLTIITNWSIATGRDLKDPMRRQALPTVLLNATRGDASPAWSNPIPSRIPAGMLR